MCNHAITKKIKLRIVYLLFTYLNNLKPQPFFLYVYCTLIFYINKILSGLANVDWLHSLTFLIYTLNNTF